LQPFRDLSVWHRAHQLALAVYRFTESFPRGEIFGLAVQLRRAAAAIPMRIAEGCGKDNSSDFLRCLAQARGSNVEFEYLILLARDLQLLDAADYDVLQAQLVEVRRMLSGLMKSVQSGAA